MEQRTSVEIWKAMTTTKEKARKYISLKNFEKYVSIANMKNDKALRRHTLFAYDQWCFLICIGFLPLTTNFIDTNQPTLLIIYHL